MLRSKTFVWLMAIVMASLACSMSGSSAPGSKGPLDSDSLATIVVGTANAAAAQTAQVDLLTGVPSAASAKATATPAPVVALIPAEGTTLEKQNDGSHIFTDFQGGYLMIVPSDWLVLRPNGQEFMNAWSLPLVSDPKFQDFLNKLQKEDPKVFRLAAADTTPEHMQEPMMSTFTVSWDRASSRTLSQEILEAENQIKILNGLKVTNTDTGTSTTRIPMGIIETSVTNTGTFYGVTMNAYQKIVVFKVRTGTVTLTLTTTPTLKDATLRDFDAMTDQVRLLP